MFEMLKIKLGDKYVFSNAAEEDNQQSILKDIINPLYSADVILADLTDQNSNVMYELGIAHALGKKTIIITKDDIESLPFDLKQYRVKNYDVNYKKFDELISYLDRHIRGAIDNSVVFGNPVTDVLRDSGVDDINYTSYEQSVLLNDSEEKEFIDYLADIEEHTNKFSEVINELAEDLEEMSTGITECTSEIDRVNKGGGNGAASFVRKQTKKVALHIESFEMKLKNHNEMLTELWETIEKNTIGLIESPVSLKDGNMDGLIVFLKSLKSLKNNAVESASSVGGAKEKLDNLIGYQRNLSQAVRFLKEDLNSYISFIDYLSSSVDKMLNRAKFVGMIIE